MTLAGEWTLVFLAAAFLFILPGWALLEWLWKGPPLVFYEKLGLSSGFSLCLYPILMLYFYIAGITPGRLLAWGPGMLAALSLVIKKHHKIFLIFRFRYHSGRKTEEPDIDTFDGAKPRFLNRGKKRRSVLTLRIPRASARGVEWVDSEGRAGSVRLEKRRCPRHLIAVTILLLFITRLAAIRGMPAPAWGDSVHHTVAVQRMLENGGLFQSWEPYAPIASFTYHFGFHASAAAWSWLTGLPAPRAVLVCGQVLNFLAVLGFFPLMLRLAGSAWAGLGAVVIAGFMMRLPGHFVNWGRYTQLTGQVILLVLLYFFNAVWAEKKRPRLGTLALLFLLLLGLSLTQYRVIFIMVTAAAAWALWNLWLFRKKLGDWAGRALALGAAALAAAACVLPWLRIVRAGRMVQIVLPVKSVTAWTDFGLWKRLDFFYADAFWILALVGLLLAFWLRPRLAWPIGLWCAAAFLAANPFLTGLKERNGLLNNEVLILAFYIPAAVLAGWMLGEVFRKLVTLKPGKAVVSAVLALMLVSGTRLQTRIVDPWFQMVTDSDLSAFRWIRNHTPDSSCFLVNGFLAFDNAVAVGSDAGWWLPFYTLRANTIPPALYNLERLDETVDGRRFARIITDVRSTAGDPQALREILGREKITHVFLGERRGSVGYEAVETVPEAWLQGNADFSLLYQKGKAQVWRFNRNP